MKNILRALLTVTVLAILFSCSSPVTKMNEQLDSIAAEAEDNAKSGVNPADRRAPTLCITAVYDNLNNYDMDLFANGMKQHAGYQLSKDDRNVYASELKSYLKSNYTTIYHTGHGYKGGISCYDKSINYSIIGGINVQNFIIATCLTLHPTAWKNNFTSNTKNILGYTKVSYDGPDNAVASDTAKYIGNNKSYIYAWYKANNSQGWLYDRWCGYVKVGSSVKEYSARTGNKPSRSSVSDLRQLSENLSVSESVLSDNTKARQKFFTVSSENQEVSSHSRINDLVQLRTMRKSKKAAIADATAYAGQKGLLSDDSVFDTVNEMYCEDDIIGYSVRFKRVINGLDVRATGLADYVSILVTENGVVSQDTYWPEVSKTTSPVTRSILSAGEAVRKAASEISRMVKGEVAIIGSEDCLGVKKSKTSRSLVPAYQFMTQDGGRIVVDAIEGNVL